MYLSIVERLVRNDFCNRPSATIIEFEEIIAIHSVLSGPWDSP